MNALIRFLSIATFVILLHSQVRSEEFKEVSFDEFFAGQLVSIPLSLEIPAKFFRAKEMELPASYSYWMRREDVDAVVEDGDLPMRNGYIYGKISMDVGYVEKSDKFTSEDTVEEESKENGFAVSEMKRFEVGGYPVWSLILSKDDSIACSLWIGTKIDTNVIYIGYQPGSVGKESVKADWSKIVESLKSTASLPDTDSQSTDEATSKREVD